MQLASDGKIIVLGEGEGIASLSAAIPDAFQTVEASTLDEALAQVPEPTTVLVDFSSVGLGPLEQAHDNVPLATRLVALPYADLDFALAAVKNGTVARYITTPLQPEQMGRLLTWAEEVAQLAAQGDEVHRRVLEVEPLLTLGQVASAVMHDLNQPLSYMQTNAERLNQLSGAIPVLRRLVDKMPMEVPPERSEDVTDLLDELSDIADDIAEGCRALYDMTSSVRRILRPTADAQRATNPAAAVHFALAVCKSAALRARARVSYDGPEALPAVDMPFGDLAQVVIQLVNNACEALAQEDGRRGSVRVGAEVQGDAVLLTVVDDGPGMDDDLLKRASEPFFSTKEGAPGLGLAHSERLLRRSQGSLSVRSTPESGTVVTVTLPKGRVAEPDQPR